MSLPLGEYSEQAIGRGWTEADHIYVLEQLRRIEALAEAVWDYHRKELHKLGSGRIGLSRKLRARELVEELDVSR